VLIENHQPNCKEGSTNLVEGVGLGSERNHFPLVPEVIDAVDSPTQRQASCWSEEATVSALAAVLACCSEQRQAAVSTKTGPF
jgi:hypothetical protein